ncbi:MAG: hypothetical protein RLN90_00225 [Balneolaceae bacterium]
MGLITRARHAHQLTKDEIYNSLLVEEDEKDDFWKILAGAGAFLLAVFTLGRGVSILNKKLPLIFK